MEESKTNEIDKLTLKRLEGEVRDLCKNRMHFCQAIKSDSDPFIFYFLLRGDDESDYEGGYYLGKILLPQTYPEKPGDFMMLTPNGRFNIDKKICLTNSGYHTENWTALWSIRNMIIGFYSIFIDDDTTGISHIKESKDERQIKAKESIDFNIKNYSEIFYKFDQFITPEQTIRTDKEDIENYIKSLKVKKKKKKKIVKVSKN